MNQENLSIFDGLNSAQKEAVENVSGGMGTAGFVGVFSTIEYSTDISAFMLAAGIILLFFVLPAVICSLLTCLMKKIGWIGEDDLKLKL